jgi:nitrosocyanin
MGAILALPGAGARGWTGAPMKRYHEPMKNLFAALLAAAAAVHALAADAPKPVVREFKSVNIEFKGSKVWVPATFIVKKGDAVKITLINDAPSGLHGFAIEGYEDKVKVAISNKEGENKKTVEFKADKAGLYKVYCHMHPAHVGGQLLVLE